MWNTRKIVGLAVTEQGITAVQAGPSQSRRTGLRTATLSFTNEVNLGQPQQLGKELKGVLHAAGLSASQCVIGLSANWIAAREKLLPPTDDESMQGVIAIATEREFASGAGDLCFDYCAWPSPRGTLALMAAAPRQTIDPLLAMAKAAGLTVTTVTSSALALATATRGTVLVGGRLTLCLLPGGVELVAQSSNGIRLLRHLPVRLEKAQADTARLCAELQRVLSLAPTHAPGTSEREAEEPRELIVWDSLDLDRPTLESIGRFATGESLPVRICKLPSDLETLGDVAGSMDSRFAQAAALACCDDHEAIIDFLHSRLAPPAKTLFGRRTQWIAAAALVLVLAGVGIFLDWRSQQQDIAALEKQLTSLNVPAQEAKTQVDNITFARGWYDTRPGFLDCLKEIAPAFPRDDTIWATRLTVRENMQVEMSGKAVSGAAVLKVVNSLKSNPKIANVNCKSILKVGSTSQNVVSFAVDLSIRGAK